MEEKRLTRELDELLAMIKAIEHKLGAEQNVRIYEIKDVFIIHMAVLHGYYDMSEALEFLFKVYSEYNEV